MTASYRDRPFAPPLTENDIQLAVFSHIRTRKVPGVFAFHPKNGGIHQRGRARGINSGLGVVSGVPDIIIIKGGECFALELKRDKGKVSDEQEKALDELRMAGAVVAVAFGLDAAIDQLERWRIVKGETR